MPTPDEILAIKAKAFDDLMSIINGKHECIHRHWEPEIGPISHYRPVIALEPMTVKQVHIYEWRFRMKDKTDLKKHLMDEAAKDLKLST